MTRTRRLDCQADFTRADLTRVVLAGAAGLDTANLAAAVLREVDLGGVWLPNAQVLVPCSHIIVYWV